MTLAVNVLSSFLDRVRADAAAGARKPARAEDSFFAPCPDCGGEGRCETGNVEEERSTGYMMVEVVRCETCDGKGCIEVEAPELEIDERDDG